MDCKTAQIMLHYARPHTADLAEDDVRALEDHLMQCPDCDAQAKAERRVEEHFAHAMKAVEVPDRFRDHLLARLDAERSDWYRKWMKRAVRYGSAIAACLVLVLGGAYGWSWYRYANRPTPDIEAVRTEIEYRTRTPLDRADAEKLFKEKYGVVTVLPEFEYRYLDVHAIALAEFQDVKVPLLVFNYKNDDGSRREYANVFVLSDRNFNLNKLPQYDQPVSGYDPKVQILHQANGSYAYLIKYTGEDFDWLKKKAPMGDPQ